MVNGGSGSGGGYSGRFSCGGDNLIVSQVFGGGGGGVVDCNSVRSIDLDSTNTRRNSDFVLLRSQKATSRRCRGEEDLTSATPPLATSTPPPKSRESSTMTTVAVELSVTRPKPAPRRSLVQQSQPNQTTTTMARETKSCQLLQSSIKSENENESVNENYIERGVVLSNNNRVATLKHELFSQAVSKNKFQKIVTAAVKANQKELSLMNRPEFKIIQQLCSSPPVGANLHHHHHQKSSSGDHHRKVVVAPTTIISDNHLRTKRDNIHQHQVTSVPHHLVADDDVEHDGGGAQDASTEDDGETTEDSTDNKLSNKPPKPGKLDLRQFDNITTAIGKLTVTPSTSAASPTPLNSTATSAAPASKSSKSSAVKQQQQLQNENQQAPPSQSGGRRINNLRQNHGRAVAPPKLPSNLLFKNSLSRNATTTNEQPTTSQSNSKSKQNSNSNNNNDNESAIDFSQSPIAQRLLKHSKDHKGKVWFEELCVIVCYHICLYTNTN